MDYTVEHRSTGTPGLTTLCHPKKKTDKKTRRKKKQKRKEGRQHHAARREAMKPSCREACHAGAIHRVECFQVM